MTVTDLDPPGREYRAEPNPARLSSGRVVLRPLEPSDVEALYRVELSDRLFARWRFAGRTPSPAEYEQVLWEGAYAQYLAIDANDPEECIAHLTCYGMELQNGVAFMAVNRFAQGPRGSALMIEALALFIDSLFKSTPVRRLYFEGPEYNANDFRSAVRMGILVEEARLQERRYFDDRYWDVITFTLTRERWNEIRPGVTDAAV